MTRSQGRYSDRSSARYSARPTDTERETPRHRDTETPIDLLVKYLHGMPLAEPGSNRHSAQGALGVDAMQALR